jgi:hypothetical protein
MNTTYALALSDGDVMKANLTEEGALLWQQHYEEYYGITTYIIEE